MEGSCPGGAGSARCLGVLAGRRPAVIARFAGPRVRARTGRTRLVSAAADRTGYAAASSGGRGTRGRMVRASSGPIARSARLRS